jgi:hypothetical protein
MNTVDLTLPEAWSSFLFYGDTSNLSSWELDIIYLTLKHFGVNYQIPLTSEEVGFRWTHDATAWGIGGSECQSFRFPIDKEVA